jgi:uncharacterized 2Fe-2S/4Fe-4S cluster protein (DUF4445 family)
VRLISGQFNSLTLIERQALEEDEQAASYRLACQTEVLADAKIDVPAESLTTTQRLQIEGRELDTDLSPAVVAVDVSIPPPTLQDLRADSARLAASLKVQGVVSPSLELPVLRGLSDRLRELEWSASVACKGSQVVAVLPRGTKLLGLAIDIGTTKLAAYLVDLTTGETLSKLGAMNPQIAHGEDVISRIAYAYQHEAGRQILQEKLIEAINQMVLEMCTAVEVSTDQIVDAVVVGNTAMHHLFAGLPIRQLGLAPYVPAVSGPIEFPASELGLTLAPSARVYLPPIIAGYVGADHVAMLLATGFHAGNKTRVALDIGTNTEISLTSGGRLLCCSCASGPAFEGAHIKDGMRASPGAIERVRIVDEEIRLYTIDGRPPVGICGSGILDAVAEMVTARMIDEKGNFQVDHPLVRGEGKSSYVVLVGGAQSGHGREIVITREDVNEIQLAKGAIRAGIEILLAEAGISHEAVDESIVAGAFGTYLDTNSAVRLGMLPDLPQDRIRQVGNAAGVGAKQMLVSSALRKEAVDITKRIEYVELTTHPQFKDAFLKALFFSG